MEFEKNLNDLIPVLNSNKANLKRYLLKNFKLNTNYIINKTNKDGRGGQNEETILLTNDTFELIKNSYNLKNKYITKFKDTTLVNTFIMNLETSTIGFIQKIFENIIIVKREYIIDNYRVDLYLPEYRIVIECDEFNHHIHRDKINKSEKERQTYIENKLQCKFIRFNPCEDNFDLANLINIINKEIFKIRNIVVGTNPIIFTDDIE